MCSSEAEAALELSSSIRMNQSSATSVTSFASLLLAIGRAIVLKFTPVCVWIWQFISRGFLSALCLAQFSSAQLYAVLILIATLAIGNGVILLFTSRFVVLSLFPPLHCRRRLPFQCSQAKDVPLVCLAVNWSCCCCCCSFYLRKYTGK